MKVLLLIPSVLKVGIEADVSADRHPRMDYYALAETLREKHGVNVNLMGYAEVEACPEPRVRLVQRLAGRDAAMALLAFLHRHEYDAIFSNGENVAIPLGLLLKLSLRRPRHVTIGHHLSTPKKRIFYATLRVQQQMDAIFVYARTQYDYGRDSLRIPEEKLSLISFHADTSFFRPIPEIPEDENQICSAGLEWRDYPTLIEAVCTMPDLKVKLAAASPWSRHRNETSNRELPPNVSARRYDYLELRELYASSAFVVVPLYENDFQAGVTTILEAMAMSKAVIVTRTTGQLDLVDEGENGLMVPANSPGALCRAIEHLRLNGPLRSQLGERAGQWVRSHATLEQWTGRVAGALLARSEAGGPTTRR